LHCHETSASVFPCNRIACMCSETGKYVRPVCPTYFRRQYKHLNWCIPLLLCEVSGSHGGEYEDDSLVGYCAV
jgi:hypothetical protein